MTATLREIIGATVAVLLDAAELGGLASGSSVLSSALAGDGVFNNVAGSGSSASSGDGLERGYLSFVPGAAYGASPAAESGFFVYFLPSLDGGATFEAGSATNPPARVPDAVLGPFNGSVTAIADCTLTRPAFAPGLPFKTLLTNCGTGQAIPSGSVLKWLPATDQGS